MNLPEDKIIQIVRHSKRKWAISFAIVCAILCPAFLYGLGATNLIEYIIICLPTMFASYFFGYMFGTPISIDKTTGKLSF